MVVAYTTDPLKVVLTIRSFAHQQTLSATPKRVNKSKYSGAQHNGSDTSTANGEENYATHDIVETVHYKPFTVRKLRAQQNEHVR